MTRARRLLPWILALVTVALVGLLVIYSTRRPDLPEVYSVDLADVLFTIGIGVFAPVGALIASRRPENPIGWIALLTALFVTLNDVGWEYVVHSVFLDASLPAVEAVAWSTSWIWTIGFALMGLLVLLFPTGALPSKRWRAVGWALAAPPAIVPVVALSLWGRHPRYFLDERQVDTDLGWVAPVAIAVLFGALALSMVSLVVRYRSAAGDERRQLKWIGYAAAVLAFFIVCNVFVFDWVGLTGTGVAGVLEYLGSLAIVAFPLSVGIAVLKYRLYDIDLVVNRTLVYTVLTAVLVGVYALGVLVFRTILDPVTGDNDVAIAASTLAVAAVFGPARGRIQRFIDRRFYRSRYDAQQTLETFAARLRNQVDLAAVSDELLGVVAETVQPAHLSLWVRSV